MLHISVTVYFWGAFQVCGLVANIGKTLKTFCCHAPVL